MVRCVVFVVAACLAAACPCAAVVYVDGDMAGPLQNGASWASAYRTIGAAIGSLTSGAEVWVKAGVYPERVTLKNYVRLYGGFLGHETSLSQRLSGAFPTVVDARRQGRGIDVPKSAWVTIDGFTVRRGQADFGGGIRCDWNSNAIIRNCRVENCRATQLGGGVYFAKYAQGELNDSVIIGCSAPNGGGGVVEYHAYPEWRRCVIARNHADVNGGGVYCPFHSGAFLENCTLAFNTAGSLGGAVWADYGGPVTLDYCIVANNSAPQGGGIYGDGVISSVSVAHTDFFANTGGNWAGAILGFPSYAGNLFAAPLFIAPARDEYHLLAASPCAGMGAFPLNSTYSIDRIGVAKALPDGCAVRLSGKIVSCVDGDITYVQEPDRASAIAVRGLSGYQPGDVLASVSGTLATENGARVLTVATASLHVRGVFRLDPVGVSCRDLPSARGIFARTWGTVQSAANGVIVLRDGNSTVTVRYNGSSVHAGDFISATGVYTANGDFLACGVASY